MYWFVFILVFLSLCAREGKRSAQGGKRDLFSRLYEFGSRNAKKEEEETDEGAEREAPDGR